MRASNDNPPIRGSAKPVRITLRPVALRTKGVGMIEKRKLTRLKLLYYLRVFDRDNFKLLGFLGDIHTQGMMLISEKPQDINMVHKIRIALPDVIEGKDEIHFTAKSLWSKPYVNPLFFQSGFQIQRISDRYVGMLESMIQNYGFQGIFKSKAVTLYRGIEGYNCAQAILSVFQERLHVDEERILEFIDYGGGNAKGGVCGALYAIQQLAENPEQAQVMVQRFDEEVGSVFCDEILEMGRLSCAGCIFTASKILQSLLDE